MKHKQGFSAWLVTREGSEGDAESQDKVVEILSPRMSPKRVREIVELLYHREATLSEKVAWRLCKQIQPYAAEFQMAGGVKLESQDHLWSQSLAMRKVGGQSHHRYRRRWQRDGIVERPEHAT